MSHASPRLILGLSLAAVLSACSDYDLHRPSDTNKPSGDSGAPVTGAPDIQVEPASLDFGGVLKNCPSAPLQLTVSNRGDEILDVYEIAPASSLYQIDWDGAAFQLAPGESQAFDVTYTPDSYSESVSEVLFSSNDPDEAELGVPTEGFGDETAQYEEGFTQEAFEALDVMWVVDNSGSMDEELDQVRTNFASFISEFVGLGLDFHLAVISTDMDSAGHKGQFRGDFITPDHPDPITEFLAQTDLGATGSGSERGMDSINAALSEPLASGANAGFLRDEAALAVIVLSDEDDDSTMDNSTFSSWYMGLKSDPNLITFNSIVGDPVSDGNWLGGCSNWSGLDMLQAEAGTRYVNMSDATGGIWKSICYEDYDETLAHVSLTSAGMVTTWDLSETPTSGGGSIEVTVDGEPVYYSLFDGFTYDETTNSVTFHGDTIPAPGQYVLFKYDIAGECSG